MKIQQLILAAMMLAWSIGAAVAGAQVYDGGDFFSPAAEEKANAEVAALKKAHGKDLVIETYPSIPAELRGTLAEQGRQRFFDQWSSERFAARKVNGVLVLLVKDPRFINVGTGRQTNIEAFDRAAEGRLRETLAQSFAAGDFDGGLLNGVAFVRQTIDARATRLPAERDAGAVPGATPTPTPTPEPRQQQPGMSMMTIVVWAVVIGIGIMLIRRMFARRAAQPQYGQSQYDPRYRGQPGQPGDQQGYGAPGAPGGSFGRGLGGGLLGGLGGMWLYDHLFRRDNAAHGNDVTQQPGGGAMPPDQAGNANWGNDQGEQFSSSGGSWGGDDAGGSGDFGGGGDAGGDW